MKQIDEDLTEAEAKNRLYYLLGERTRYDIILVESVYNALVLPVTMIETHTRTHTELSTEHVEHQNTHTIRWQRCMCG
jgi:hypothetical protein